MKGIGLVVVSFLLLASFPADAGEVWAADGNIFFKDDAGITKQMTESGRDTEPALSADRRWIAFVRIDPSIPVDEDQAPYSELWILDRSSALAKPLVKQHYSIKPEDNIGALGKPAFSPDGSSIYFLSKAWMTSGAIHSFDLKTQKSKFISPGNSLYVIGQGKYKGYLIASKHKYFLGAGSYDFLWLVDPVGKEIGMVGEDESRIDDFVLASSLQ
jgi:hypothetical protein